MIILGIDPGTTRVGYGVLQKNGGLKFLACGVIGSKKSGAYDRLRVIERGVAKIVKKYRPALAAIEKVYFSKNRKTAMAVAEAKGVIILTLGKWKIPLREFSPSEVKSLVVGSGRSDKRAVQKVVALRLKISKIEGSDDAADALALAIRASFD